MSEPTAVEALDYLAMGCEGEEYEVGGYEQILREVLAERDVLAAIVRGVAETMPHRQEYYSGGQYWHFCLSPGCDGWPGYGANFGPGTRTTFGKLEPLEALMLIDHGAECQWWRARVWSEGQQNDGETDNE